ncbi:MAG: DNA-binding response regulator [Flavobacteriia bacterium 40-80]|nr:MAG: DNA-binding response regulator [Flavobacteriia bacterium 40-80]
MSFNLSIPTKNQTVLLVDDEEDILEFLKYNLEKEGYRIYTAKDGQEAVNLTQKYRPDLVIMDVMMPNLDGIEACHAIRSDNKIPQPVIAFLTSRSEDYSQIAGFEVGADDYITKPIRPRLLVSKVESLLRRKKTDQVPSNIISLSGISIDRNRYIVKNNDIEVTLPKKEFELLDLLISQPDKVHTRDEILSKIWGNDIIVGERTIDVHIRKLREKFGNRYIRTIKGVGYTFNYEK